MNLTTGPNLPSTTLLDVQTPLHYARYHGCGNSFLLFDVRWAVPMALTGTYVRALCQRDGGDDVDGLIFVESSPIADCKMRIFNPDGSEAEMCGNGIRCLKKFLQRQGNCKRSLLVETSKRILEVFDQGELIGVKMGAALDCRWNVSLPVGSKQMVGHYLDTGVPHLVIFDCDLVQNDIFSWGRALRYHPYFQPAGVNVNFVQVEASHSLHVRTYERGVEKETLACGTGATAAALAAAFLYRMPSPIQVRVQSGDSLFIAFSGQTPHWEDIILLGPAIYEEEGVLTLTV